METYKEDEIDKIVEILQNDGIICVPTDTVYGICGRIDSFLVYKKIRDIKHRDKSKPFAIMCANEEQIKDIAIVNEKAEKLIKAFMPGPITLILEKKSSLSEYITNGLNTIAIRMATSKVLEDIILKLGVPVFMTSANISGEDLYINIDEIKEHLPSLNAIIEGEIKYKQASTIVDCTKEKIEILREGPITLKEIEKVLEK